MINKKISILLSSVLGIALTMGIMQGPALADDKVQDTSISSTSNNSAKNNNYIVSKDNSIEKNGLKISIDKIEASKHKLKATVKVESQTSFDKNTENNVQAILTYGDNKENGSGMSFGTTNDKTLVITLEKDVDEGQIPEKGDLRIDIVIPKYKINVGMNANVDFSEAFKNMIEKEVSVKLPEFNITVNKLESNMLGTDIIYSEEKDAGSKDSKHMLALHSNELILKIGDKMYPTENDGIYSSGDSNVINGAFRAAAANYDKVKDQNNISLIPIVCTMTEEEREKFYKDNYKNRDEKKEEANKETTNNVSYTKNFEFSDGTKGEIYNVERNDNSVKVYYKGATEKESLLMASSAALYYKFEEGQEDYEDYYGRENMTFYKDPKESLGYIAEFNNVKKDKAMELGLNSIISQIDKYKIGDEIQLSK